MFLKFYVISTVICCLLLLSVVISINAECKKAFTKEELAEIKKKKEPSKYAWFVYVFFFVCPILNIILVLVCGFNYGEVRDTIMRDYRKRIGKQTRADILGEEVDNILKNIR